METPREALPNSNLPPEGAIHPQARRSGCLVYLLLAIGLSTAVLVAIGIFVARRGMHEIRDYTSERPLNLPSPILSELEQQRLDSSFRAFEDAISAGRPAEIRLTGREVNALLRESLGETMREWQTQVTLENGKALLRASIPTGSLTRGVPGAFLVDEERYLNGTLRFALSKEDGKLELFLEDIQLDAPKQLEAEDVKAARENNLATDLPQSSLTEVLDKVKRLQIEGDTMKLEG